MVAIDPCFVQERPGFPGKERAEGQTRNVDQDQANPVHARRQQDDDGFDGDVAALGQALGASLVGYVVTGFFLSQAYAAFLYTLLGMIGAYALSAAREAGQRTKNHETVRGTACTRNVKLVTTPKFPPPPPRRAQ